MLASGTSKQLVLGGHSWFSSLANDPGLTPAQHVELFNAALDSGITVFDTTYQGERLALGAAMAASGRRDEATVIVWNFLCAPQPSPAVGMSVPRCPRCSLTWTPPSTCSCQSAASLLGCS
jgi:hypothetical protein